MVVRIVMDVVGKIMVEIFLDLSQDQQFKDWLAQHPDSFYLNKVPGKTKVMLHKVGCFHLGSGEGVVTTTHAKFASDNLHSLIAWAAKEGMAVDVCQTCAPD